MNASIEVCLECIAVENVLLVAMKVWGVGIQFRY
jgi:hypothetical protein